MCLANTTETAAYLNEISNMENEDDPIRKAVDTTADALASYLKDKHEVFVQLHDALKTIMEAESMPYYLRDRIRFLLKRADEFL